MTAVICVIAILFIVFFLQLWLKYKPSPGELVLLNRIGTFYDQGTLHPLYFSIKPIGFFIDGQYHQRPATCSFRFVGQYTGQRRALAIQIQCYANATLQVSDQAFADAMVIIPGSEQVQLSAPLLPERCEPALLPELQRLFLELKIEQFDLQPAGQTNAKPQGHAGRNLTIIVDAVELRSEPTLVDELLPAILKLAETIERAVSTTREQ